MAHTPTHRHTRARTHTAENDNEVKQKAIIFIYCPDAHYGASNIIPADAAVAADSADALPHKPHHCQLLLLSPHQRSQSIGVSPRRAMHKQITVES